jgi:hypothetical protein
VTGYLHALVEDAAREAGCTVAQMLGYQRTRPLVAARWRAIRTAYAEGYTSGQIARVLNRDPSTVVHALNGSDVPHAKTGRSEGSRYTRYPSFPQADHQRAVHDHAV